MKKYLRQIEGTASSKKVRNNSRTRKNVKGGGKSNGVYNAPGYIAVLGDIHGDYGAFISALSVGGLIRQRDDQLEIEY